MPSFRPVRSIHSAPAPRSQGRESEPENHPLHGWERSETIDSVSSLLWLQPRIGLRPRQAAGPPPPLPTLASSPVTVPNIYSPIPRRFCASGETTETLHAAVVDFSGLAASPNNNLINVPGSHGCCAFSAVAGGKPNLLPPSPEANNDPILDPKSDECTENLLNHRSAENECRER